MTKTVLVVDDDEAFLEEMSEVLTSSGYKAVAVSDPLRVVEVAQKSEPSLILMDLKMPGKNGYEIASELKGRPELSGIPIIAVSGLFQSKRADPVCFSVFRKCLTKPFHPLDVIWLIENVLFGGKRACCGSHTLPAKS